LLRLRLLAMTSHKISLCWLMVKILTTTLLNR
jgi:hypothetical protein